MKDKKAAKKLLKRAKKHPDWYTEQDVYYAKQVKNRIKQQEKLNDDPLSKDKRTDKNKVKSCQFELYVDYENGRFKSWSKAMVSAGYAFILIDIFNSLPIEEAKKIKIDDFKKIKMDELLTMSRKTGFYEMIEIMIGKLKNVGN